MDFFLPVEGQVVKRAQEMLSKCTEKHIHSRNYCIQGWIVIYTCILYCRHCMPLSCFQHFTVNFHTSQSPWKWPTVLSLSSLLSFESTSPATPSASSAIFTMTISFRERSVSTTTFSKRTGRLVTMPPSSDCTCQSSRSCSTSMSSNVWVRGGVGEATCHMTQFCWWSIDTHYIHCTCTLTKWSRCFIKNTAHVKISCTYYKYLYINDPYTI